MPSCGSVLGFVVEGQKIKELNFVWEYPVISEDI